MSDIDLFNEPANKKKENVDKLVAGLKKQGLDVASNYRPTTPLPTGIKSIDGYLLDNFGGIPRGRFTEVAGFESTGKSYLMYYLIAHCQRQGGLCVLLDGERAYDNEWGSKFGIDNSKLIVGHYKHAEHHYDQIFWLLKNKEPDLIISDSVASLIPEKFMSTDESSFKVSTEICKTNKKYLRLLFNGSDDYPGVKLPNTKTALIFLNHLSEKIGMVYGDAYDTGGGKALKYWAHLRLRLSPAGWGDVRDSMNNPVEQYVNVKVMKSRISKPGKSCKIKLDWHGGIDDIPSELVFHIALEKKLVSYSSKGGMIDFEYNGEKIKLRGKMKFVEYCENDQEFKKYIMESNE